MRLTRAGESHGRALVAIIEGIPVHVKVNIERINAVLALRQGGYERRERQKTKTTTWRFCREYATVKRWVVS